MKKSLIALALMGAFSGTALAQSSVTLYGIVDIGVQMNTSGVNLGTTAVPRWSQEDVWGVDSGYQSGSRWGMRGSEALGSGWSAVFTLEGGYSPDTGTLGQSGRLFGRQAWAGLASAGAGTFVLGRLATPSSGTGSFDQWGFVDPFATGWGINSLGSTFIPSNALREDNGMLWASPTWGGFNFAAMYSFNVNGSEVVPSGNNTTAGTLAGKWAGGPFAVAITYDVFFKPDNAAAGVTDDQTMMQIGGTWDFKVVKLHAGYAIQRGIAIASSGVQGVFIPTGLQQFDNNAYMGGVTVPLFGGSLLASYQYADAKNVQGSNLAVPYTFEADYSVWGIGYSYPFSRRTNMYVGYGQRSWDGSITQAGRATDPKNAFDKAQFALGIRHLF
jgi:general bacterial porin, GBP family